MKRYIAGPMRGLPEFNHPAFIKAAVQVVVAGHEPISPVEICVHLGLDKKPAEYMRLDLAELILCDGIVLLDHWHQSTGAKAEAAVALVLGMSFFELDGEGNLRDYSRPYAISVTGY